MECPRTIPKSFAKQFPVKRSTSTTVAMVGAFPPPVHGAALVNLAIHDAIVSRDYLSPRVFNLAPPSLKRSLGARLLRAMSVPKSALGFVWLCFWDRPTSLYVGASGGLGQLYEAAFVLCARCFSVPVIIHHHSFVYIDRPSWHVGFFTWIAGDRALHVALCPEMANGLSKTYRSAVSVLTLSNAIFVQTPSVEVPEKRALRTIGFLGNISEEKGIYEFIEIAKHLSVNSVQIVIAGPFQDSNIKTEVLAEIDSLSTVMYLGPKYGRDKEDFLCQIDVLVFPSKYEHEAEPLTVLEALAHGVPIIATERGCIKRLVPGSVGKVVGRYDDFASVALDQINEWRRSPSEFAESANAAKNHFSFLRDEAKQSLQELLDKLGQNARNSHVKNGMKGRL